MDATKGKMAAITMVGGDHFFLTHWVRYYGAQLGRENLYVLSHGGDPEHLRIADGCNVIYLPYDPTRYSWNQRRWQMLSLFATAFQNFYNWVVCGDVDELVGVDPAVSDNLADYVCNHPRKGRPKVLTPFAIEMVHNPRLEPEPIDITTPILPRRRIFRLNANYAKPCVVSTAISFAPGGHFANHDRFYLDPNLYLFHLRFIDYGMTEQRLALRRSQRLLQSGDLQETGRKVTGWDTAWDSYKALSGKKPKAETVEFADTRKAWNDGWRQKVGSYWTIGGGRSSDVYRLPERFSALF